MSIGRLFGIPVRLHWSFLALVAFGTLSSLAQGFLAMLMTLALGTVLFGSVVLHELGHALAARSFGIRTAHITLYPMGGVAALRELPRSPGAELVVALAGPAVNAVLVALAGTAAMITGWNLFWMAAGMNAILGVFNLIPAYPMDGGRALRALLWGPLGWLRASRIAMDLGVVLASIFALVGLVTGSMNLVLVGGFLILVNRAERAVVDRFAEGPHYRTRWNLNASHPG